MSVINRGHDLQQPDTGMQEASADPALVYMGARAGGEQRFMPPPMHRDNTVLLVRRSVLLER